MEADLRPKDALEAEVAMVSSTPSWLLPVTRLDAHRIGGGRPGRWYGGLMKAWSGEVGVDIVGQFGE